MNKVILIGNMGRDPVVRHLENGVSIAKFSLATTEHTKNNKGEKVEHTEWHNIVLWRGLAEYAEKKLSKSDKVLIEGKIRTRSWENKEGVQRYTTEIIAENVTLLMKRSNDAQNNETSSASEENNSEFNFENLEETNSVGNNRNSSLDDEISF